MCKNVFASLIAVHNSANTTIFSAAQEKADKEKASEIQEKILKVYSDFNSRLSNYERRNAKAFFKQFKTEINAEIEAIINSIEEI